MTCFEKMKAVNRALKGQGNFNPKRMKRMLEETHEQDERDDLIVVSRVRLPGIELIVPDPKIILV